MSDGISNLDQRIARFEELLDEMKEATREAHGALKQLLHERKEIERLLSRDVNEMVDKQIGKVVRTELDKIGPEVKKQSSLIYDRVGKQIDKLIDIALGKEFSANHDRGDLRPQLAAKLRIWLREIVDQET